MHGFRVEVGEIEAAIRRHPAIGDAAVVARAGTNGEKTLIGYYTQTADRTVSPQEIRSRLRELLPAYMVPPVLTALPRLPLTHAGKIDRVALAAMQPSLVGSQFVAPATPLEVLLTTAYAQVLGVDRISINDNFFDLGGGSIQIIEIISRAAEAGVTLTPELFFEYQTVSELAAVVEATNHGA